MRSRAFTHHIPQYYRYAPVLGDAGHASVAGDVEHHAARDNAVAPRLDPAERRPVEADLLLGITAVPHAALVPRVAERVDVGGLHAMVEDAVIVGGEATARSRDGAHVVLGRVRVARARLFGELAAQRDAAALGHQPGGGHPLLRRDEIQRADLVVLAPAAPVAPV